MELTGRGIIGYRRGNKAGDELKAFNPSTGEVLSPTFYSASDVEIEEAVQLASESFTQFSGLPGRVRGAFLVSVAEHLEQLGEELVERAVSETGLPVGRIRSERGRTCSQLKFFAKIAETASWVDARIDRADPGRLPVPKPDVRSMLRPLGPTAVFCASNFPLAFSVAGGDTASALASGNTVVVLAHYAHPGTAELAGTAIRDAARKHGLPEGVFSLLFDSGHRVAQSLVAHPVVKAGGFTGSRAGGLALLKVANSRRDPIPFYAEMSSINPVFVLPGALASNGESLAKGLHESATLGVGQFCTNPGVVVAMGDSDAFVARFVELMSTTNSGVMLNRNIASSYKRAVSQRALQSNVKVRWSAAAKVSELECSAGTAVFETDARNWLEHPELQDEIFGPATLLVRTESHEDLLDIARGLDGNLTATILGTEEDLRKFSELALIVQQKVGRILFNGFPTGVEVCEGMVHGGPYPATSDGRSTSVGGRAILRFTRPVCYQNCPNAALPPELQEENPLRIWRMEDSKQVQPG